MKSVPFSIVFTFLSLSIFCQNESESRYFDDLQKAETIQDTIAAWCTYQITTPLDSIKAVKAARLIDETLMPKYPQWGSIEKASFSRDSSYSISNLKKFVASAKSTSLRKYALTLLQAKKIEEGIATRANNEVLSGDLNNPKDIVFSYYLKTLQFQFLNQTDSIVQCMKKGIDGISEDIYPGLQLSIITRTCQALATRISKETSSYIDTGLKFSKSLDEIRQRAELYNSKVLYLKGRGETEEAMTAALNFIKIKEKIGDVAGTTLGYINLASFHQELGRFDEAYKLIFKARKNAKSHNNNTSISHTYSAEAYAKMNEKKYTDAIRLLKKSEEVDQGKSLYNRSNVVVNIIDCYYTTSKLDSAYLYFNKLEEMDPQNSTGFLSYAKSFVSGYLVQQGDYKLAQEYIDEAMADAEAYDDLSGKSLILKVQSELYEAIGNDKDALTVFKEYHNIEQDFRNEDLASATTKIQLESDFEKEKKIIDLTNEKENLKITSERNQALFLSGLALLSALSALGFYLFVRRKNTQINIQNQKLVELNNVKDTLFQIIGHDLKKPTINFRNVSKNINFLLEKQDYKRLQNLGAEVDQDAKSLYNLTDNLLNWALMQKDTISIKPKNVNVHEIVNYNFDLFATLAKRKGITLENRIGKDVSSMVDRNSIDTIVRNLIDNALKYTQVGGLIALDSKITDGAVRLSITDNGVGMNKNVIDAIFNDQSIKSEKGTEGEKGSGIGLLLVKQLLKKNKGTLEIQSTEGNGSTISINLQLAS